MNHGQPLSEAIQFRSRDWVLHQATEEQLLEHLQQLLVAQRVQQEELKALVEMVVEENLALQEEMEQAASEAWLAEDNQPRTPWLALGVAGLIGYLLGRRD